MVSHMVDVSFAWRDVINFYTSSSEPVHFIEPVTLGLSFEEVEGDKWSMSVQTFQIRMVKGWWWSIRLVQSFVGREGPFFQFSQGTPMSWGLQLLAGHLNCFWPDKWPFYSSLWGKEMNFPNPRDYKWVGIDMIGMKGKRRLGRSSCGESFKYMQTCCFGYSGFILTKLN